MKSTPEFWKRVKKYRGLKQKRVAIYSCNSLMIKTLNAERKGFEPFDHN